MENRFKLNIGPISGAEQLKLNQSRVFIAGCGGVGGYLLEYMTRLGVGHITCADCDRFEESNQNRQILCSSDTLGKKKAECAVGRVLEIWPQADIRGLDVYLAPENLPGLIGGFDLVMDALDNVPSRKALGDACFEAGIALAHGAASGWLAQAALAGPGRRLYDVLYEGAGKPAPGILPFAAALAASMQAALAAKYLCSRRGDGTENRLHILDLQIMEMDSIEF